jgi:hypothetical protein
MAPSPQIPHKDLLNTTTDREVHFPGFVLTLAQILALTIALPGDKAFATDTNQYLFLGKDNVWSVYAAKNTVAAIPPTVANDNTQGYAQWSQWMDTVGQHVYVCISAATGAAVWKQTA